jgi:predicted MFS family arabinose efflux permease
MGWSNEQKLLVLMSMVCISIVSVFVAPPPKVIVDKDATQETDDDSSAQTKSKKRGLLAFILFLGTVFVSMFTSSNLMETGPIIIKEVFNVDLGHSAFGLAASAALTIVLLEPAGRLAEKSSPYIIWMVSFACYAITAIGLWLAVGNNIPSFVPVLLIVLLMQAISWFDMVIPAIADELSPSSPALTQGLLMFAMALGFGVGTFIAGQLIDASGFVAVVDYCAASILVTLLLAATTLLAKRLKK